MKDFPRQTGITTRQIKNAPKDAVFIWRSFQSLSYPQEIAKREGRDDLRIVSLSWLEPRHWRGRRFPEIILDHACGEVMREQEWRWYEDAKLLTRVFDASEGHVMGLLHRGYSLRKRGLA